eukprot:COSAG02_NODE_7746_length_2863_cov_41.939942_2_plen_31_part_00
MLEEEGGSELSRYEGSIDSLPITTTTAATI